MKEADRLIAKFGLENALVEARRLYTKAQKDENPGKCQIACEAIEEIKQCIRFHAALDKIEQDDPVARYAAQLVNQGITNTQLKSMIGFRHSTPLGCELHKKFVAIKAGRRTTNAYGKQRRAPKP
jgi:hypothetical protein